jgi:hypothetical protein
MPRTESAVLQIRIHTCAQLKPLKLAVNRDYCYTFIKGDKQSCTLVLSSDKNLTYLYEANRRGLTIRRPKETTGLLHKTFNPSVIMLLREQIKVLETGGIPDYWLLRNWYLSSFNWEVSVFKCLTRSQQGNFNFTEGCCHFDVFVNEMDVAYVAGAHCERDEAESGRPRA